jgi:hypothetical protein
LERHDSYPSARAAIVAMLRQRGHARGTLDLDIAQRMSSETPRHNPFGSIRILGVNVMSESYRA